MNHNLLKTIIFIVLYSTSVFSTEVKTMNINTQKGYCSAVLMKVNNKCHLVTNAHCFNSKSDSVTIGAFSNKINEKSSIIYPKEFHSIKSQKINVLKSMLKNKFEEDYIAVNKSITDINTEVINIDKGRDLATLQVPKSLLNTECKKLKNLTKQEIIKNKLKPVIIGFSKKSKYLSKLRPITWYPDGTKIENGKLEIAEVEAESVVSTLKDSESFLKLNNIKMIGGNSGGIAVSSSGQFLGISTRYHPTQDEVYVIQRNEVIDFIQIPTSGLTATPLKNGIMYAGGNSGTNGGGNSGTNGGGNTGANGGGNSGSNGGGNTGTNGGETICFSGQDYLSLFVEPDEGFFDNIQNIVILSAGGKSIDGYDDYKSFGESSSLIIRERNGFPILSDRKGIITRLMGDHHFSNIKSKTYKKNPLHVQDWEEIENKENNLNGNFHLEENKLTLSLTLPPKAPKLEGEKIYKSFKITPSKDFKSIILKSDGQELTCKNNNYMKLICKNGSSTISISKNSNGNMTFRYAKEDDSGKLKYFYSEKKK